MNTKFLFDIFIISWTGFHDNSRKIALELQNLPVQVTIVWSDQDIKVSQDWPCHAIQVSNDWYFGKKFQTCLENVNNIEHIMIIQGDVSCADWKNLIARAFNVFRERPLVGVWAPQIDYTWFSVDKTEIGKLGEDLHIVAQTDSIVFSFKKTLLTRLKQFNYDTNKYGWGIDWAVIAIIYSHQQIAVVDKSITIHHPSFRGYDSTEAIKLMRNFLNNLSPIELIQYHLLHSLIMFRMSNERISEVSA